MWWRLLQIVIIFIVGMWLPWWVAKPGDNFGIAPGMLGMFFAYAATQLLSWLIDFVRWLVRPAARPFRRRIGLHDQPSGNRAGLTAVRFHLDELAEQPPRPRIGHNRR
jgi:hypothetical protein